MCEPKVAQNNPISKRRALEPKNGFFINQSIKKQK